MIICMVLASLCFLIFAYLYLTADENITIALIACCIETQKETIKKTQIEMRLLVEEMKRSHSLEDKQMKKKGNEIKEKIG